MRLEEEIVEQQWKEGKNAKKGKGEAEGLEATPLKMFPKSVQHLRKVPEGVCGH